MNLKAMIQRLARQRSVRRIYTALSAAPLVGPIVRRMARSAFPVGTRVWLCISSGIGKGIWANLDPRYEMTYVDGRYESPMQKVLSSHLGRGSVFYDVGAHIGIVSMLAARLVGETGSVFAFEADAENVVRIEANLRRNDFTQIKVVPYAAWSCTTTLRFARASANSSRNQGAVVNPGAKEENGVEVQALSLDDFASENRLPTLVKIDVEGAEAEVLRGSEKIFASAKPDLICEVHYPQALDDVTQWLLKQGYHFKWLEDSPALPRHLLATHKK